MMLKKLLLTVGLGFVASTSASAQQDGDVGRGKAYALATCASCHGVLSTDLSSPRPNTITFKEVANAPGMTGTAINVFLLTPHKSMPNLIIEPRDRTDVIAYIVSLHDAPKAK